MSEDVGAVVAVYTTNDVYEAEIIRNELREEGIACELDGESQGGFTEIVQTKVLVRANDAGQARRLIGSRAAGRSASPRDGA